MKGLREGMEQRMKFEFVFNPHGEANRPDDSSECAGAGGQGDQVIHASRDIGSRFTPPLFLQGL